jgi:putative transcriptional regulator
MPSNSHPSNVKITCPDARGIRARLHLTQAEFAHLLGVSTRAVEAWEQGQRIPRGPAATLLRIADRELDVLARLNQIENII